MSRIKIDLPLIKLETITIPVRIGDINYGNHVGNDAFVSIIHEARMRWFKKHHYTEMNFAGSGLIMSDIIIEFKNEVIYGDNIVVDIYCGEVARVSFELFYLLQFERDGNVLITAKAKTGMVCYNYQLKKTVSIPEEARLLLAGKS